VCGNFSRTLRLANKPLSLSSSKRKTGRGLDNNAYLLHYFQRYARRIALVPSD
jgi:hypothetical protein